MENTAVDEKVPNRKALAEECVSLGKVTVTRILVCIFFLTFAIATVVDGDKVLLAVASLAVGGWHFVGAVYCAGELIRSALAVVAMKSD